MTTNPPALLGQAAASSANGGSGWESGETLGGYLSDH